MTIYLKKGDCVEYLKTIPNKSIDFILTDPPYELENHGGGQNGFGTRKLVKDLHIDFISKSFDMDSVFLEIERISKKINLVMFCSNKQVSKIMKYWEDKKYSVTLLVWDKPNPTPLSNGKYISSIEFMVYVRGKNATFNNIGYADQLKSFKYGVPSSKSRLHPTEKPIELLERLIKIHTSENDIVLDMFMGSCTTGIACINTNRNFIGCEIDENYFNISLNRVEEKRKEKDFKLVT